MTADKAGLTGRYGSWREMAQDLLEAFPDGIFPIMRAGEPVLRIPAVPYDGQLGELLEPFIDAMRNTMRQAPGVGLAAPQIGFGLALAVVEDPGIPPASEGAIQYAAEREREPFAFRVLVNPVYERATDEHVSFAEGCLSVPGYEAVRSRWRSVWVRGTDERGNSFDETLWGWPARIVQHETDHLRGELYIDQAHLRTLRAV